VKMLTYLSDRLSTVSKDSWHYRLTRYGLGDIGDHIKRACPYWVVLVPIAAITGTTRQTATVLFNVALYVGYYPWMAFVWTFGFKPRYWRGLTAGVLDGKRSALIPKGNYRGADPVWHWYVPILMAPVLTMAPIIVYVFDFGHQQADAITALPVYLIALVAYAGLLAVIALGNGWKLGAWPLVHKAYCAVCPELKVVESAPSRSQTEPAS